MPFLSSRCDDAAQGVATIYGSVCMCLQATRRRRRFSGHHVSSSSAFPSHISGAHHFGETFADVTGFFFLFLFFFVIPTVEIVTFRLRGWRMLGVFLLLAFTRLGHECQDLLRPCDGMHVYTD